MGVAVAERVIEEWRPVVGFEGDYEVSNMGGVRRIRNCPGGRKGYHLKPYWRSGGKYPMVNLRGPGGCRRLARIHKLVTEAFLGVPGAGFVVNHKDGNTENNWLANLEYVTVSANGYHAYRTGLIDRSTRAYSRGSKRYNAKLTEEQVREMRRMHTEGAVNTADLGRKFGVGQAHAWSIVHGRWWKHA